MPTSEESSAETLKLKTIGIKVCNFESGLGRISGSAGLSGRIFHFAGYPAKLSVRIFHFAGLSGQNFHFAGYQAGFYILPDIRSDNPAYPAGSGRHRTSGKKSSYSTAGRPRKYCTPPRFCSFWAFLEH